MASTQFRTVGHMKFSSVDMQALSDVINLLGISLLSHFISRRVRLVDVSSLRGLRQVSLPRLFTVATFCDSWAFLFTTSVLVHGLGLELNQAVCTGGVAICIAFYATSKAFIFMFLTEKIHVVWSSAPGTPRRKSPIYLFCVLMIAVYLGIGLLMINERNAYFRHKDGVCMIGLKRTGSLVLLCYDVFMNIVLLLMFLWPFLRARVRNLYLRSIALRAIYATLLMLASSTVNILILTLMDGRQVGWVCLTSCTADIIVNAAVLFWATSGSSLRPEASASDRARLPPGIDGAFTPSGVFIGGPHTARSSHASSSPSSCCSHCSNNDTSSTGSVVTIIHPHDIDSLPYSLRLDGVSVVPGSGSELSVILEEEEKDIVEVEIEEAEEEEEKGQDVVGELSAV